MRVTVASTYLGSIGLYKILASASEIGVEVNDHYSRQTFRTRTEIMGPNGCETLIVPVVKPQEKTPIKDILINNDKRWQMEHLRSIEAAYNSSPFTEYYIDDLMPFYTKPFKYLADFNMGLQQTICELIGITAPQSFTESYERCLEHDYRALVEKRVARENPCDVRPYYQVFQQKFGFKSGLSIIDLLMNMGPESILYLK